MAATRRRKGNSRFFSSAIATINEVRYCHGDFDTSPTCYEQAQQAVTVWPEGD